MDLELLHNYNTSTSYTLSNIPALQHFLLVNVPRIGFSHPFVLHSILAISAVHLAHFKQGDSHSVYVTQAHYHYDIALRTATSLITEMNEEHCAALYIFGTVCSPITLGMGAKPGDFLVFGDNGIPEWLILFRGMRAILDSNPGLLESGELAPMFQISIRHINHPASESEHLRELEDLIEETAINDPHFEQYMTAVDKLSMSFPVSPLAGPRVKQPSPQLVFVWLYRLSDDFVLCLQQRKPIALVILAHFCVLLHDLSSFWWLKGWVDHLMTEIYASVNEEYRIWMRWPMEEIGWIPPE